MKGKILIVEDDKEIRTMLAAFLEQQGYEVMVAGDGRSASGKLKEQEYELLLLDLMLPFKSGEQLIKNLDYQKQLKLETEKAEKSIRRSVSDIAHDLRTPLMVIKGNLQMLQMEEKLSHKGEDYVGICRQKADEMREMADDFFQLSVLESDLEKVLLK